MSDSESTIEFGYIALPQPIDGAVVIDDAVFDATIVGIEVVNFDSEDRDGDQLVAIVRHDYYFRAKRFDFVYHNEQAAEADLKQQRERLAATTSTARRLAPAQPRTAGHP